MRLFTATQSEHYASFAASPGSIEEVRDFIQSALLETDLGTKAVAGLQLAVEEAVTNITRHGYLYGPGRFNIRVRTTSRSVSITLTDKGRPYEVDWDDKPDPGKLAETGRRGGLGLLLIRKVTDSVSFRRVADENILILTKDIEPHRVAGGAWQLSARVARIGMAALTALVLIGSVAAYLLSRGEIESSFKDRWREFAQAAGASAAQHLLNRRSDAEFDQLVVGLKSAKPDLCYIIITDEKSLVRAHSERPESVHRPFTSSAEVSTKQSGVWEIQDDEIPIYHLTEIVSVDRRMVGAVLIGVPKSALGRDLAAERKRIAILALAAIVLGGVLVGAVSILMGRPLRRLGRFLQAARAGGGATLGPAFM